MGFETKGTDFSSRETARNRYVWNSWQLKKTEFKKPDVKDWERQKQINGFELEINFSSWETARNQYVWNSWQLKKTEFKLPDVKDWEREKQINRFELEITKNQLNQFWISLFKALSVSGENRKRRWATSGIRARAREKWRGRDTPVFARARPLLRSFSLAKPPASVELVS